MNTLRTTTLGVATLTAVVLSAGPAVADTGDGSGGWPAAYPLPLDPGAVVQQSSTTAVVRSTDTVVVVKDKLDAMYVTGLGCTSVAAVNKPRDYFCPNAATSKTDEIYFTFAALDSSAIDPSSSQTSAFYVAG